jgi:hypothetical protein
VAYVLTHAIVRAAADDVLDVTYLIPVVSTALGVLVLSEPLGWNEPPARRRAGLDVVVVAALTGSAPSHALKDGGSGNYARPDGPQREGHPTGGRGAAPLPTPTRPRARPRVGGAAAKGDPLLGELRRGGLLPLLVLHFLSAGPVVRQPAHGARREVTGGLIAVNPNTMYPLLRSLEARGWSRGSGSTPSGARGASTA